MQINSPTLYDFMADTFSFGPCDLLCPCAFLYEGLSGIHAKNSGRVRLISDPQNGEFKYGAS